MKKPVTELLKRAVAALPRAYSPYSNFSVACCIESASGELFVGVNIENVAYGLSICAEAAAICQMVSAGEREILQLAVVSSQNSLCSPCGSCRQRIHEFSDGQSLIHLCDQKTVIKTVTTSELLPLAFKF